MSVGEATQVTEHHFGPGESWRTGSAAKQARLERYVEWLLTPEASRTPPTKARLAEEMGVSPQTLRNYAKDPWLQRELLQRGRTLERVERAQDVINALYAQARDPSNPRSVAAARVYLDWINRAVEPALENDPAEMSDEELEEALFRIQAARQSLSAPADRGSG